MLCFVLQCAELGEGGTADTEAISTRSHLMPACHYAEMSCLKLSFGALDPDSESSLSSLVPKLPFQDLGSSACRTLEDTMKDLQREASHSPVWGDTEAAQACTHCALVGLLARVSSHVHNQHVLGFEGFLLSWTIKPTTHKLLLFAMNVVIIDMLRLRKRERKSRRISHFSTQQKEVTVCSTFKPWGHMNSFTTSQFKRHLVHTFLR